MRFFRAIPSSAVLLIFLCWGSQAIAQPPTKPPGRPSVETISVTAARPVARLMDIIEKRYAVLIDYVDPQYAAPQDMQVVRSVHGIPVKKPYPIPKIQSVSLRYEQVPGCPDDIPYISCNSATIGRTVVTAWPKDGVTALIRKVLDLYATRGGPVFLVRKIEMPYGPRWEVYPEEVRDISGKFVYQPDFLSATILLPAPPRVPQDMVVGSKIYEVVYIPKAENEFLHSIYRQLEETWGDRFRVAGESIDSSNQPTDETSGHYMNALRALANFMGPARVLRLLYAPDNGMYYPNMVTLPYRPPPRPSPPPPSKPVELPPRPLSPLDWLLRASTGKGVQQLQTGLAKAGYPPPTTRWDANAADAIRRFQMANGLPATGKIDQLTISRLEPYLPKFPQIPPPPRNPLGPNLIDWLQSTRRGWTEIQTALAESGFYRGQTTGKFDLKTRNALKAYQTANDLRPTGVFDDPTSRKLAPLLLKMKD